MGVKSGVGVSARWPVAQIREISHEREKSYGKALRLDPESLGPAGGGFGAAQERGSALPGAGQQGRSCFRAAIGRTGKLSERSMSRVDAWYMVRRRARDAGIETAIGNHSFRAIGITDYLERGGDIN